MIIISVRYSYTAEWKMFVPEDYSSQEEEDGGWGTIVQQWGTKLNENVTKVENPGKAYMIIDHDESFHFRPTVYAGQENGKFLLTHANYDLGKVEFNKWISFKQEIVPSSDGNGLIRLWKDGELVAEHSGPNIVPEAGNDNVLGTWKVGAYTKRENNGTRSLWFDDIKIEELDAEETVSVTPDSNSEESGGEVSVTPDSNSEESEGEVFGTTDSNFGESEEEVPTTSDFNAKALDISGMPIEIWRQPEGTQVTQSFEIEDINSWNAPRLNISAFDLDDVEEAKLYLNDTEIPLPEEIIRRDGGTLSDSIDIDRSLLAEGNNTIACEFASNLNNSTEGFAIKELSLTQ